MFSVPTSVTIVRRSGSGDTLCSLANAVADQIAGVNNRFPEGLLFLAIGEYTLPAIQAAIHRIC